MNVGYARVSTGLQNLDLQMDVLTKHGCVEIFTDKISGAKEKQIGLEEALRFIREGDTLVVWRLDRIGRNMQHLIQLVNELNDRGISFHSLQENITMDRSNATGQLMFHLFAAFAEFERNLIQERSAAGRVAARARGRLGGRPAKFGKKEIEMMKALAKNGTPIKNIATMLETTRATVYRYINKWFVKFGIYFAGNNTFAGITPNCLEEDFYSITFPKNECTKKNLHKLQVLALQF